MRAGGRHECVRQTRIPPAPTKQAGGASTRHRSVSLLAEPMNTKVICRFSAGTGLAFMALMLFCASSSAVSVLVSGQTAKNRRRLFLDWCFTPAEYESRQPS